MKNKELQPAMKLTITIGGDERHAHHPLYQEILKILHECGVGGATLLRGVMSYGIRRRLHTMMNEVSMGNLPIIIEAVDEDTKVEVAAERVAEILGEHGLVQLQPTAVASRPHFEEERSKS